MLDALDVELARPVPGAAPRQAQVADGAGAERRFWRTIEGLSAWCTVHSLHATLTAQEFDPVAESSPLWEHVTALARSVDQRSPWTSGHSPRVSELLVAMAEQLRLGGDVRQYLRMAGLLHDVGNMGVPIGLLEKPAHLSPDEVSVVRRHPELGARIVREVNLLKPVAAGVYHHHEQLDGGGYPLGLVGESIPLMARMVSVAACFDAMTSARPYRDAIEPERALGIMRGHSGEQWDPSIVDALARILRNGGPAAAASALPAHAGN